MSSEDRVIANLLDQIDALKAENAALAGAGLQGILLGMGNPLLDISSEVPMSMCEKYGLKMGDAAMVDDNNSAKLLPLYQDLVDNFPVQYIAGGATQNSIRVAQWMLQGKGSATSFMGCVGNDKFGKVLADASKEDGVNVNYCVDAEAATGTCAVLVNGGERSLCANLAAANNYKLDHLKTGEGQAMMEKAQFYYSSGFFLTVSPESMQLVGEHAAAQNKVYTMNLAAPFLIEVPFFYERMVAMIPYCDFIFCNESEAASFGKKNEWGEDLKVVATKLAAWDKKNSRRPRTVVFTQGSECTLVACDGKVTEFAVPPLSKDKLVDTNGAGDAFVGGFLSQLVQGQPISKCVEAGHYGAREVIQRSGCTFPAKPSF
jgi:adenosine kinase